MKNKSKGWTKVQITGKNNKTHTEFFCPRCGALSLIPWDYCPHCGKHINKQRKKVWKWISRLVRR